MRGVIVGDVRDVDAERRRRAPSSWRSTPTTSTRSRPTSRARLLPKTLFGERFVALVVPGATRRRAAGRRRRHRPGPQRERHRAAAGHRRPAPAAAGRPAAGPRATRSGAVADALRGRGDVARARTWRSTGDTSARSTPCCRSCRPTSPSSPTSPTPTTRAADDLLAVLDNLSITNTTIVDQQEQLRRTFTVVDALVERHRGLPGDQRAEPHLAGRRPRGRCSACSPSTRPSTRACSTA